MISTHQQGIARCLFILAAAAGSLVAQVPNIATTKTDTFTPNGAGKALPGAPIKYTTTLSNTGTGAATGVIYTDATPANTTLVPGSANVSPLAGDDVYSAIVNTQLAVGSPTVLSGPVVTSAVKATVNDTEFLSDTFIISTFSATSAQGGSVAMVTSGANMGSFTYVPAPGFTGTDSFTYTLRDDGTDSTANNADDLTGIGTVTLNVADANTGLAGTQKLWLSTTATLAPMARLTEPPPGRSPLSPLLVARPDRMPWATPFSCGQVLGQIRVASCF